MLQSLEYSIWNCKYFLHHNFKQKTWKNSEIIIGKNVPPSPPKKKKAAIQKLIKLHYMKEQLNEKLISVNCLFTEINQPLSTISSAIVSCTRLA